VSFTSEKQRLSRIRKLKQKWHIPSGYELLKRYFKNHDFISVVCSFSGGRDSLAITLMTLDVLRELRIPHRCYILFNNTTNEFPETIKYVRKMFAWFKEKYSELNIVTVETRPKIPFSEMVEDMFYVAVKMHEGGKWDKRKLVCCDKVKIEPLIEFLRGKFIQYVVSGIRGDESRRRYMSILEYGPVTKGVHNRQFEKLRVIRPLWNFSQEDVIGFLAEHPLKPPLNPLYAKGHDSIGCCLCPVPFIFFRDKIKKYYPQKIYERGLELLKKAIERTGQSLIDTFLGAEILLEEWG